jgi:hypothetical protein
MADNFKIIRNQHRVLPDVWLQGNHLGVKCLAGFFGASLCRFIQCLRKEWVWVKFPVCDGQ